jgi:hypothetical protein
MERQLVKGFDVTSGQLSVRRKFSGKMFYFSLYWFIGGGANHGNFEILAGKILGFLF